MDGSQIFVLCIATFFVGFVAALLMTWLDELKTDAKKWRQKR